MTYAEKKSLLLAIVRKYNEVNDTSLTISNFFKEVTEQDLQEALKHTVACNGLMTTFKNFKTIRDRISIMYDNHDAGSVWLTVCDFFDLSEHKARLKSTTRVEHANVHTTVRHNPLFDDYDNQELLNALLSYQTT